MNTLQDIQALFAGQPKPVCAALTPFEILEGDAERGYLKLAFAPQPAFGNHFGHIQGGFLFALMDVPVSCVAFLSCSSKFIALWMPP